MLDPRFIRENPDLVGKALIQRLVDIDLDRLLALDRKRRDMITETEALKRRRNEVSREIGRRKASGEEAAEVIAEMKTVARKIHLMDELLRSLDEEYQGLLLQVPNIPQEGVPVGPDARAAVPIREGGRKREFGFRPSDHMEIGERLGLFDFTRAARMAGSNFPLFTGSGARLVRGLINFMIDLHVAEHGFTEICPPLVVNRSAMTGTGQLPKMEEDMYRLEADDLFLIPTAEVPVTNIHREEIVPVESLPLRYVAYSPCFRREAGSYGKETRGLIRLHQFDKVELVAAVEPGQSGDEHVRLLGCCEEVVRRLELPYRILELPTGDLSFAAARCYDIELWAPGQGEWLECSSVSNFEDFQARRARIRFRAADGAVGHPHTLNGSGVALPRTIVAILENFQEADGSVTVPDVLRPYLGGISRLEA